jgi:hypothetical protein
MNQDTNMPDWEWLESLLISKAWNELNSEEIKALDGHLNEDEYTLQREFVLLANTELKKELISPPPAFKMPTSSKGRVLKMMVWWTLGAAAMVMVAIWIQPIPSTTAPTIAYQNPSSNLSLVEEIPVQSESNKTVFSVEESKPSRVSPPTISNPELEYEHNQPIASYRYEQPSEPNMNPSAGNNQPQSQVFEKWQSRSPISEAASMEDDGLHHRDHLAKSATIIKAKIGDTLMRNDTLFIFYLNQLGTDSLVPIQFKKKKIKH